MLAVLATLGLGSGVLGAQESWQTVVVYPGTNEPQAPLAPSPFVRPVVSKPGQGIAPWPRPPQAEDAREATILNAQPGAPARMPMSPIITGATPDPKNQPPASAAAGKAAPLPPGAAVPVKPEARKKGEPPPEEASAGQQYCFNIADAAADARFAWQQRTLAEIEQELDKRVALLEKKTKEYQTWLARREDFVNKAQEGLLRIYAKMRPDAAAAQISAMDEETAAAMVTRLDPRAASAILAEMDPQQAARLSATIAGAARTGESREQAAANAKALQREAKP
ncbi:MAG: MotE family protein [Hyphomicrobiaceae bacterium]